jgi:hypothetical protein
MNTELVKWAEVSKELTKGRKKATLDDWIEAVRDNMREANASSLQTLVAYFRIGYALNESAAYLHKHRETFDKAYDGLMDNFYRKEFNLSRQQAHKYRKFVDTYKGKMKLLEKRLAEGEPSLERLLGYERKPKDKPPADPVTEPAKELPENGEIVDAEVVSATTTAVETGNTEEPAALVAALDDVSAHDLADFLDLEHETPHVTLDEVIRQALAEGYTAEGIREAVADLQQAEEDEREIAREQAEKTEPPADDDPKIELTATRQQLLDAVCRPTQQIAGVGFAGCVGNFSDVVAALATRLHLPPQKVGRDLHALEGSGLVRIQGPWVGLTRDGWLSYSAFDGSRNLNPLDWEGDWTSVANEVLSFPPAEPPALTTPTKKADRIDLRNLLVSARGLYAVVACWDAGTTEIDYEQLTELCGLLHDAYEKASVIRERVKT